MSFVTSRGYTVPENQEEFNRWIWFNLWTKKLWPYYELEIGDTLYWYESPSKCVVWKSRVVDVLRFDYYHKTEVAQKLDLTPEMMDQDYFTNGPESGYCLHYKVEAIERANFPRPDGFRFPMEGWLRVTKTIAAIWPGLNCDS